MLPEDISTKGLHFALKTYIKPGALQAQIQPADSREE